MLEPQVRSVLWRAKWWRRFFAWALRAMAWPPGTSIRRFNNRKSIDVASDDVLTARRRRRRVALRGFVYFFTRCNKNAKPHESSHSRARTASRLDRGRDAKRSGRHASRCASRSSRATAIARARGEGDVRVAAAGGILERRGDRERARERERATRDEETIAMVTLDADEPVVVDIGARAHVTMSPKRMREMGVSAGAWTTVRCYATPRDDSAYIDEWARREDGERVENACGGFEGDRTGDAGEEGGGGGGDARVARWRGKCWRGRLRIGRGRRGRGGG